MKRAGDGFPVKTSTIHCEALERRKLLSYSVIGIEYVPAPLPVAGAVNSITLRNQQDIINVLSSDMTTLPATLIPSDVQVVIGPTHGSAVVESNGSIAYTPAANYTGSDSFTYTVEDTNLNVSMPGLVSIAVNSPPLPLAGAVVATTAADTPVNIGVLSSDSATAPATLIPTDVQISTMPVHGTAIPQSDGSIVYTPTNGYFGSDSFTYTVQDSNGDISIPGTVSITITQPAVPIAGAVTAATYAGSPLSINVLSSDVVTAPATLIPADVLIATAPTHGSAVPQSDGTILYTPAANYSGPDSFSYTVQDTNGQISAPGVVTLSVNLRTPPTAGAVSVSASGGQAVTINVLGSDSATLPATLIPADVQIITTPAHGTAIAQLDGSILYTAVTGYAGTDSFTYTVQDTNGQTSAAGTVSISVTPPTPPTAGQVIATTTQSAPVKIGVLSSDSAAQGTLNPASVTVVTAPAHGNAVAQSDGTILYTPAAQYTGSDTFTYTVADSLGDVSAPAVVTLTITAAVPPVILPITAPVIGGQTNNIDVLSSVTGGAPLVPSSVTIATPPANGTATVNISTGSISYIPKAGFVGTDTFTYTVANIDGATSAPATLSVNVGTTIASTSGAPHTLTFTNATGSLETLTLNKGTAQLFFSGSGGNVTVGKNLKAVVTGTNLQLTGITLSSTTAASVLSVRGPAHEPLTIGGITDTSPLGSIVAPQATLNGILNLSGLGVINVASISDAVIGIGAGGPARLTITAGAISNTSLDSAIPIASLRAASWIGTSADTTAVFDGSVIHPGITAPSINSLSIAGAFNPNLSLSSESKALTTARITGAVAGGTWTIAGSTGSVTAGSIGFGWMGDFGTLTSMTVRAGGLSGTGAPVITAGAVGSLVINGNLTGGIAATSAKLIRVNGSVNHSNISVAGTLGQLVASGSLIDDSITTGGNLTSLTAGSMLATTVTAGVNGTPSVVTASSASLGSGMIGNIRLTGRAGDVFSGSQILAGKIISASLGGVTTANGGIIFGLAADTIGSLSAIFAGKTLRIPRSDLASGTLLNGYLQGQALPLGDFEIAIAG